MTSMDTHRLELDLHQLDLRFAASRLVDPQAVARIAQSIERCGQIVPCIVAPAPGGADAGAAPLVLIDGYRRVAALRRLGRDTASVEQWTCGLTEAVLGVLARAQDRSFAIIEEALLLRELMQGQGLSQQDLARRCGRDVSWVSRRLQLLSGLPDAALAAVRTGKLSTWAANRVVVPLARANAAHADSLLTALAASPLSTRELQCWFAHYQQAAQTVRECGWRRRPADRRRLDPLGGNGAWPGRAPAGAIAPAGARPGQARQHVRSSLWGRRPGAHAILAVLALE